MTTAIPRAIHVRTCPQCGQQRPLDDYLPSPDLPNGQIETCRHCLAREPKNKKATGTARRPYAASPRNQEKRGSSD